MTQRYEGFTQDERDVLHYALQQTARSIMDKAAASKYEKDTLGFAAGMFHLASTLAGEVGVTLGFSPADTESLEMTAVCIAEGEAPFAARMAAEVEEDAPVRSLGAHAGVRVSVEEDEAA